MADRLARLVGRGRTRAARAERGERREAGRAAGREALAAARSRPVWSGALDWAGRVLLWAAGERTSPRWAGVGRWAAVCWVEAVGFWAGLALGFGLLFYFYFLSLFYF